jgi:transcriptional regulator with GAF, ATPase, and Fis domain
MVVQSPEMANLVGTVERIAPFKTAVLIQGESGTGKELIAASLHKLGPMPTGPFVIFNCSNLIGPLADAQLFGHVRGAFTDAREDSLGYFRSANKGTLFLDEVGELPLQLQPKLLRVLETYEVQAVGSTKSYKTDVRIVAATNRNLLDMVKAGTFREDLYHRLSAVTVYIPPLRERTDGKRALLAHFVERANPVFGKQVQFISHRALDLIESHPWTGNVRELANCIQSAVMLARGDRLCVLDFPHLGRSSFPFQGPASEKTIDVSFASTRSEVSAQNPSDTQFDKQTSYLDDDMDDSSPLSLHDAAHRERKRTLLQALAETGGNCTKAAKLLGVSRFTIYRLVERYGLSKKLSLARSRE